MANIGETRIPVVVGCAGNTVKFIFALWSVEIGLASANDRVVHWYAAATVQASLAAAQFCHDYALFEIVAVEAVLTIIAKTPITVCF